MHTYHVPGHLLGGGSMKMNETQTLSQRLKFSRTLCDEGLKSDTNKFRNW